MNQLTYTGQTVRTRTFPGFEKQGIDKCMIITGDIDEHLIQVLSTNICQNSHILIFFLLLTDITLREISSLAGEVRDP